MLETVREYALELLGDERLASALAMASLPRRCRRRGRRRGAGQRSRLSRGSIPSSTTSAPPSPRAPRPATPSSRFDSRAGCGATAGSAGSAARASSGSSDALAAGDDRADARACAGRCTAPAGSPGASATSSVRSSSRALRSPSPSRPVRPGTRWRRTPFSAPTTNVEGDRRARRHHQRALELRGAARHRARRPEAQPRHASLSTRATTTRRGRCSTTFSRSTGGTRTSRDRLRSPQLGRRQLRARRPRGVAPSFRGGSSVLRGDRLPRARRARRAGLAAFAASEGGSRKPRGSSG